MDPDHPSSPGHLDQERDLQRCRELLEQNRPGDFYRTLVNIHHRIFADQNDVIHRLQEAVLQRDAAITEVTAELKALRETRVATITKLTAELEILREIVATSSSDVQDFSEMMCRYEAATKTNDAVIRRLNYENRRLQAERDEVAQEHAMEIKNLENDRDASTWMLEAQERRLHTQG